MLFRCSLGRGIWVTYGIIIFKTDNVLTSTTSQGNREEYSVQILDENARTYVFLKHPYSLFYTDNRDRHNYTY